MSVMATPSGRGSIPATGAADVLRHVFAGLAPASFAFRLWDATQVRIGPQPPAFTVVFTTPETFTRLMRDPTPYAFAEAYVAGALDIEGDLFAAMHVAETLESLRLPLMARIRLGWRMRAALRRSSSSRHA
jgi:cyclopropane-fatty-acyl-phospholipid synthase